MAMLELTSDNKVRSTDKIEVSVYDKPQQWYKYNPETGKHDIPSEVQPAHVVITINEWEQVVLNRDKVILLIEQLQRVL
jgi:hypothetical protein